jgi:hypothetical protein
MLSDLLGSVERSFDRLNINRLLFIGFILGVVLLIDYKSGFSFYYNLDSQVEALQAINNLNENGLGEKQEVKQLYDNIISDLKERQKPLFQTDVPPFLSSIPRWIAKFLAASYIWLVATPFMFVAQEGRQNVGQLLFGLIAVIVISGAIGIALPIFGTLGINFTLYTLLQIATLFFVTKYGGSIRQQREEDV